MIPITSRRSPAYTGTGAPASYSFGFKVFSPADIAVRVTSPNTGVEVTWVLNTQYTVFLNADQDNFPGGTVTPVTPLGNGYTLVVIGNQPYNQTTQFPTGGAYNATITERTHDRSVIMVQQLAETVARTLQAPASEPWLGPLPPAGLRLDRVLYFDSIAGQPSMSTVTMSQIANAVTAAYSGSAGPLDALSFLAAGTGAVSRTAQAKARDTVCVKDFGAKGDGVTNDTAAMQAAHNTGKLVYYPAGTYIFTTISFSAGGIRGDGKGQSILRTIDTTAADIVTYTGTGGDAQIPLFRDFRIDSGLSKPAGAALRFAPSSGQVNHATVDNFHCYNIPTCIQFDAAAYFKVVNCDLINYTNAGVSVANSNNVDSGDSVIAGCLINTGMPSGSRSGIIQFSSGGLKVYGNKILGGNNGFVEVYSANTGSGPLKIVGNSIENTLQNGIFIGRNVPFTGGYGGITIIGNEIGVCLGNGISTDSIGGLVDFTIVGNYIQLSNTTFQGVSLNGVDRFLVASNTIVGGDTAVYVTATCAHGRVSSNLYASQTTATVNNSSTTTFVTGTKQSGTVASIAHTSAYGSLFIGSAAVVFPTPFTIAPTVNCNAGGGFGVGSGFSAFATNITKTGFTYNLVGIASGSTANNTWSAEGVI